MISELADDYIRRRVAALGHGDNYHYRFRHFVLSPREIKTVDAGLQLFILVTLTDTIRVEGDGSVFDLTDTNVNELQYEHQGTIHLTNYSATFQHVIMIEVFFNRGNY